MLRIAFVVPRCGADVVGGAEQLCLAVAERLGATWSIEVLTTCARDHRTWANAFPPGEERAGPVRVRRFPVDAPRDLARFPLLCERVLGRPHAAADERAWLDAQGPGSPALLEHLRRAGAGYDAVVFFTYLYAPTVDGLPLVADRAVLVPTAHDEPMIHLALFRPVFRQARALVFLTPEERAFVNRTFGTDAVPQDVAGLGLDPAPAADAARFRARHAARLHGAPFVLAAGRIEPGKGYAELFTDFQVLRLREPARRLKLVLTGPADMPVPDHPDVVHLGVVPRAVLADAVAAAAALVVPSACESLSLVALQAWQLGVPVIANGRSPVLVGQCRRSNGGLWYERREELGAILRRVLDEPALREALGAAGRRWVEAEYRWPAVEARWRALVEDVARATPPAAAEGSA